MTKVSLFCSSCNALNEVSNDNVNQFVCKYCGVNNLIDSDIFVIDKEVDEKIPNSVDFNIKLKNAKYTLNSLRLYDEAYVLFKELYLENGDNIEVLEGLMISLTHNFNYKSVDEFDIDEDIEFNNYLKHYEKIQKRMSKVTSYYKKYNKFLPLVKSKTPLDELDSRVDYIKFIFYIIFSIIGVFLLINLVISGWFKWNL